MKKFILIVFAVTLVFGVSAWADTITFSGNAGAGTGSVTLTPNTIMFTGGPLDLVKGSVLCPAGCTISGGSVSLQSGNDASGPTFLTPTLARFDYDAGGSLVLMGSVNGGPSGVLLTATFDAGGSLLVNTSTGSSTYNAILANINLDPFFGVPIDGSNTENLKINFANGGLALVTATGTTLDTHPASTPEPATLSLLGVGLLGVTGVIRRKLAR